MSLPDEIWRLIAIRAIEDRVLVEGHWNYASGEGLFESPLVFGELSKQEKVCLQIQPDRCDVPFPRPESNGFTCALSSISLGTSHALLVKTYLLPALDNLYPISFISEGAEKAAKWLARAIYKVTWQYAFYHRMPTTAEPLEQQLLPLVAEANPDLSINWYRKRIYNYCRNAVWSFLPVHSLFVPEKKHKRRRYEQ